MSAATRLARTHSVSLVGRVETQVGRGLVQFVIVGLPDASVRESKDRVRSALESCGLEVLDSRVTINLSPAGLHKSGSGFDLAIAASVLLAAGRVGPTSFDGAVIIGELALDGSLQPVRGVLPAVLAARGQGITRAIVPAANAAEASLVGGVETAAFAHLAELVRWAGGNAQTPVSIGGALPNAPEPEPATSCPHVDMADVRGQHDAVEALTVAGAGGHHVFLLGEPGSGKTMLASRMHTILPDLDDDTALVATSLHSLAGTLRDGEALVRRPPILTPHHSATMAALVGGGHARIRESAGHRRREMASDEPAVVAPPPPRRSRNDRYGAALPQALVPQRAIAFVPGADGREALCAPGGGEGLARHAHPKADGFADDAREAFVDRVLPGQDRRPPAPLVGAEAPHRDDRLRVPGTGQALRDGPHRGEIRRLRGRVAPREGEQIPQAGVA